MTAPTSPGVVPANDMRELVERLRRMANDTHFVWGTAYQDRAARDMGRAADMLERLANRSSLTDAEFQIVGYLKPARGWTLNPVFVRAQPWSDHPWMQTVFTIPVYASALALARTEPRQEMDT